jgi:FkbM family methyltransferase
MCIHAVEPEPEAAQWLRNQSAGEFREWHVHELALGEDERERDLVITQHGSMSSLLQPDLQEFERGFGRIRNAPQWMKSMETVGVRKIKTTTLEQFCIAHAPGHIDFLKLDTQGSELYILKGAGELLRSGKIGVICTEVALHPIYKEQGYFSDIDVFLRACGFRLVDLQTYPEAVMREDEFDPRQVHERPRTASVGDAWYVFNYSLTAATQQQRKSAAIVLACEGYFSEASYLVNELLDDKEQMALFAGLSRYSRERGWKHFLRRWIPMAIQQWRARRKR